MTKLTNILLIGVVPILIASCVSSGGKRTDTDSRDYASANTEGLHRQEFVSDRALAAYNQVARRTLRNLRFGSRHEWRTKRFARTMNAVLQYDAEHDDLFAAEVRSIFAYAQNQYINLDRRLSPAQKRQLVRVFKRARLAINFGYRRSRENFLWRLGAYYHLAPKSLDIVESLYGSTGYSVRPLTIIDTGELPTARKTSLRGNYNYGDAVFIDQRQVSQWAALRELDVEDTVEAIAVHETAHNIHGQLFDGRAKAHYRKHIRALSKIIGPEFNFYRGREVEEFLADAAASQLSSTAVRQIAFRIVATENILRVETLNGKPKRVAPHYASAEFLLRLFREEEARRGVVDKAYSIDRIRAKRNRNPRWLRKRYVPYLDWMLDDDTVNRIQAAYREKFISMMAKLR